MIQNIKNVNYLNLMKHDFSLELFIHSNNVANIAMKMADEIKLCAGEKQILYEEALYHDIGKSKIPEAVLYKKSRLSPDEWEIMKQHTIYSQELYLYVVDNNGNSTEKARIIRHHHENWDGTGYPDKIMGEDIPLHSRIIRIADIFDAITQRRIYRPYRIENPLNLMEEMEGKEIESYIFRKNYYLFKRLLANQ
ncbi:HD domain-containing protein [Sedimentibacter hydroxybenzoicus DSM 7310]|uniref:HD domain-containing protein n=1 Tax=Sedimentibacter hydroxybenzoicus DSM 7310 TaxID=1123245 RepID=A0A974GXX6_SEDHY|nr:HD domain-containing phosphohydrolase [Sedimentibacter hydroxybenzoicus]NYB75621.1 HD domain-containing protein [Sedimentibacter hydroxybenzoicus DSM 7310]